MANKPRVMVVCGFGLGSSMVLKMTLDDVLKEEDMDVETFCADSFTAPAENYDLVFTSEEMIHLFENSTKPKIVITNFLSKDEVREKGLDAIKTLLGD